MTNPLSRFLSRRIRWPEHWPQIRNPLLREEMPWLVGQVVLLLILFSANPPELWFWLVVLVVVLLYRLERWWSSRPGA